MTKIDLLRKVLYLFQKVVHDVKHFLDREEMWMTQILVFFPRFSSNSKLPC